MIDVESVTNRFGSLRAIDRVSFQPQPGELVGFIGPNGAGKSTMPGVLATYLYPTAGRLRVADIATRRPLEVRRRIGYLAGDAPLYQDIRADRFLVFVGRAHGLEGLALEERLQWLVGACAIGKALGKRIAELPGTDAAQRQ